MVLIKALLGFVKVVLWIFSCPILTTMPKMMMTRKVRAGDTSGPWRRSLTVSHFLNDSFPDLAVSPTSLFS